MHFNKPNTFRTDSKIHRFILFPFFFKQHRQKRNFLLFA